MLETNPTIRWLTPSSNRQFYFRGGKSDPFASLGALTGIAPKSAPAPSLSMNQQQQQQQQNNQFNQYMNNNVGAPASTVTKNMFFLT